MRLRTHRPPGLVLTDHTFELPLEPSDPGGETLEVFAREVVAPARESEDLPWLLFLQGGPGFGSPRPSERGGWLGQALETYRVLLLDQRGTGRSTPVLHRTLARRSAADIATYLSHFRADAIVADAERIRREVAGDGRWTVLGQSYGGFVAAHYLSAAPGGLAGVMFTGGLPPIGVPIDDVYRATYRRVVDRNRRYYERYPDDADHVGEIVQHLTEHPTRLPGGDPLTPQRLLQLGMKLGAHDGAEQLHFLLEDAFVKGPEGLELGYPFLRAVEAETPFAAHPIYAALHESIYCEGAASRWSADRIRPEFSALYRSSDGPPFFTGEMVYPWMFRDYAELEPLREAAELLAAKDDWPALYDSQALRECSVPSVAAVYHHDMYVEREYSEQAANQIGGCRTWVTSEYEHDALRTSGKAIFDRLLAMLRGDA